MKRRVFLKGAMATAAIAVAVSAGLVTPRTVLAAWPEAAFRAKKVDDALVGLFGTSETEESEKVEIRFRGPIAEDGNTVPVEVYTSLPGVESISILVEHNPSPLTSRWTLGPGVDPFISARIKMAETSNVIAVVQADGKLYRTAKEMKVTEGGCGG